MLKKNYKLKINLDIVLRHIQLSCSKLNIEMILRNKFPVKMKKEKKETAIFMNFTNKQCEVKSVECKLVNE